MKFLIRLLFAGLVAATALSPPLALARERNEGRGYQQGRGPNYGYPGARPEPRGFPPAYGAPRAEPRGPGGYGYGYDYRYDYAPGPIERGARPGPFRAPERARPAYPLGYPRTYGAPTPRAYGRGAFLPPGFAAAAVADPRAYHLRRPPNGYIWVIVGANAYLAQRSTGLILDTAPLY